MTDPKTLLNSRKGVPCEKMSRTSESAWHLFTLSLGESKTFCRVLASIFVVLILVACGGDATPTPSVPLPPATLTPLPSPTPITFFVSILNRRLTRAEIVNAIRREGTVIVGGWNYAARDALVKQFQEWVKREFGVEVKVEYVAEASPATYLENLDAARQASKPAPYDVIAVEENYFFDAQKNDAVEKMLPSDLLNNAARVESAPNHDPYALAFQASSTVAPIFHNDTVGAWFRDWKDLADARLKRRITLPQAEGIVAGAFLIGVAGSLNKDYKNLDEMRETIEFVCTQMVPNAYTITSNMNLMRQLLREDRIDAAVSWNVLARLEGLSDADGTQDILFRPMTSGQPAINGYAWIPKGVPHPVLAQLFINWRLSDEAQLPNDAWEISKLAWGEYHEGLLGASYEKNIPAWIQENYFKFYPSVGAMEKSYKTIEWGYYAAHEAEWMQEYGRCVE